MKRFTGTSTIGTALSLLVAGQLLFLSTHQANEAEFQSFDGTSAQLEGLACVSKKLFFPKPPEKEIPEEPSLIQKGK
ncbi:hypothetical protein ACFOET_11645 [Parapedobacter deserti]|uniref:Uncharacterized protein n=1 Tax=Parapedobacter deserti TaxID=1912957 RepID=A0ABV7JN39_9SPHI